MPSKTIIKRISTIFTGRQIQRTTDTSPHLEYFFSDDVPESLKTMFRENGMEVDDYHYYWLAMCMDAYVDRLKGINGQVDEYVCVSIEENILCDLQAEDYLYELLNWFSERISRVEYVNEVLQKPNNDIIEVLQAAQLAEQTEVYQMGFNVIRKLLNVE